MQTMFRSSIALAVCAAGLFSVPATAQMKVGVVSLQKAILETAEIKKAGNDMQIKYKKRQDDLDKAQRVEVKIYDRQRLRAGDTIDGPALIHQFDATTLLLGGQRLDVLPIGALEIREAA